MRFSSLLLKSFSSALSLGLSVVVFSTNCLLAHAPEANFWKERKKAVGLQKQQYAYLNPLPSFPKVRHGESVLQRISIGNPAFNYLENQRLDSRPPQDGFAVANFRGNDTFRHLDLEKYGTIRKITNPKLQSSKSKTIIHIQDVHMNSEAQRNIGKAVHELINNGHVDLIALEGAFEPIDLKPFRTFPHQDAVRKVADYLLKGNKISGPIHAAFHSTKPIPQIVGVDDRLHYKSNVEAYRHSAPLVKGHKKRLKKLERDLVERKANAFNTELKAFDQMVQSYRKESLRLGAYVRFLSKHIAQGSPTIEMFLKALNLESSLNFSRVEAERTALLSRLLLKLSQQQTSELINHTTAYRLGHIRHASFYHYLNGLCEKNGVPLSQFPAMDKYLEYILLSESIDAESLFGEIKQQETAIYQSLAKSDKEKQLVWESKRLHLLGKLLDFALTKEEWEEYRTSFFVLRTSSKESNSENYDLSPFESFYTEAEARDEKMAENFIKQFQSTKYEERSTKNVSVLVTGGFHSKGIGKRLAEAGVTVIDFVPKITKVDTENGSAYLSVFSQEKTPLEKLFEGEKLFLAGSPLNPILARLAVLLQNEQDFPNDTNAASYLLPYVKTAQTTKRTPQRIAMRLFSTTKSWLLEGHFKENGDLEAMAAKAPFYEQVKFTLIPVVLPVFLLSLAGVDPFSLFYVRLIAVAATSVWLGFSHKRIYQRRKDGRIVNVRPAKRIDRIGLAAIAFVFRIGFLFVDVGLWEGFGIAYLIHEWHEKVLTRWLRWLPLAMTDGPDTSLIEEIVSNNRHRRKKNRPRVRELKERVDRAVQDIVQEARVLNRRFRDLLNRPYKEGEDIDDLLSLVEQRVTGSDKSRFLIGISSNAGAGGRGVVKRIANHLKRVLGKTAEIITMDDSDFYKENQKVLRTPQNWYHGTPDHIYQMPLVHEAVANLKGNKLVLKYIYDESTEKFLRFSRDQNAVVIENGDKKRLIIDATSPLIQVKRLEDGKEVETRTLVNEKTRLSFRLGQIPVSVRPGENGTLFQLTIRGERYRFRKDNSGDFIYTIEGENKDRPLKNGNRHAVLACVKPPEEGKRQIVIVQGNSTLHVENVVRNPWDLSIKVRSSLPVRQFRRLGHDLQKEMNPVNIWKLFDDWNFRQREIDFWNDRKQDEIDKERGKNNDKATPTHFQMFGLNAPEWLWRAFYYHAPLTPEIKALFREHGVDMDELFQNLDRLGRETLIRWIESIRKEYEDKGDVFSYPTPEIWEPPMSEEEAFERYWRGYKGKFFVTLAVARRLLKSNLDPTTGRGTLGDDAVQALRTVLERGYEIFVPGEIVEFPPGALKGPFSYTALVKEAASKKITDQKRRMEIDRAFIINQAPFVEGRLRDVGTAYMKGVKQKEPEKIKEQLDEAIRIFDLFFETQKTQWKRGLVDRAPNISHRYGLDLWHGLEAVLCLAPSSLLADRKALAEVKHIADEESRKPLPDCTYKALHEKWGLKGYQIRYVFNRDTEEDYLAQIPECFRDAYCERIKNTVPANVNEIVKKAGFRKDWREAKAAGTQDQFRNVGVSVPQVEHAQISYAYFVIYKLFIDYFLRRIKERHPVNPHSGSDTSSSLLQAITVLGAFSNFLLPDSILSLQRMVKRFYTKVRQDPDWLNQLRRKSDPTEIVIRFASRALHNGEEPRQWEIDVLRYLVIELLTLDKNTTVASQEPKTPVGLGPPSLIHDPLLMLGALIGRTFPRVAAFVERHPFVKKLLSLGAPAAAVAWVLIVESQILSGLAAHYSLWTTIPIIAVMVAIHVFFRWARLQVEENQTRGSPLYYVGLTLFYTAVFSLYPLFSYLSFSLQDLGTFHVWLDVMLLVFEPSQRPADVPKTASVPTLRDLETKPYRYEITDAWRNQWPIRQDKALYALQNVRVANDPTGGTEKVLEVTFPKGSVDPTYAQAKKGPEGGAIFYVAVPPTDELVFRYDVFFPKGFDFARGGKLPGLFCGERASGGVRVRGSSFRGHWRPDGAGEVYLYAPEPDAKGQKMYGRSLGRGKWTFTPGQWHTFEQRVKLGTPNKADGKVEVWFNGKLVHTEKGLVLRTDAGLQIDQWTFQTFFGGDDATWASPKDQKIYIRRIEIAKPKSGAGGKSGNSEAVPHQLNKAPIAPGTMGLWYSIFGNLAVRLFGPTRGPKIVVVLGSLIEAFFTLWWGQSQEWEISAFLVAALILLLGHLLTGVMVPTEDGWEVKRLSFSQLPSLDFLVRVVIASLIASSSLLGSLVSPGFGAYLLAIGPHLAGSLVLFYLQRPKPPEIRIRARERTTISQMNRREWLRAAGVGGLMAGWGKWLYDKAHSVFVLWHFDYHSRVGFQRFVGNMEKQLRLHGRLVIVMENAPPDLDTLQREHPDFFVKLVGAGDLEKKEIRNDLEQIIKTRQEYIFKNLRRIANDKKRGRLNPNENPALVFIADHLDDPRMKVEFEQAPLESAIAVLQTDFAKDTARHLLYEDNKPAEFAQFMTAYREAFLKSSALRDQKIIEDIQKILNDPSNLGAAVVIYRGWSHQAVAERPRYHRRTRVRKWFPPGELIDNPILSNDPRYTTIKRQLSFFPWLYVTEALINGGDFADEAADRLVTDLFANMTVQELYELTKYVQSESQFLMEVNRDNARWSGRFAYYVLSWLQEKEKFSPQLKPTIDRILRFALEQGRRGAERIPRPIMGSNERFIVGLPTAPPASRVSVQQAHETQWSMAGAWGLWLLVENGVYALLNAFSYFFLPKRWQFTIKPLMKLTPKQARWRFFIYGLLEAAVVLYYWGWIAGWDAEAAVWFAFCLHLVMHAVTGVFRWNGETYELLSPLNLRSPPSFRPFLWVYLKALAVALATTLIPLYLSTPESLFYAQFLLPVLHPIVNLIVVVGLGQISDIALARHLSPILQAIPVVDQRPISIPTVDRMTEEEIAEQASFDSNGQTVTLTLPHHPTQPRRVWSNDNPINSHPQLTKDQFLETANALKGSIVKTPLTELQQVSGRTAKRVFLKDEARQIGGAFKARGVYNEVLRAIEEVINDPAHRHLLRKGLKIVTQSTGNHGIALIRSVTRIIDVLSEKHKSDSELVEDIRKIEPVVFSLRDLPLVKRKDMIAALNHYKQVHGTERGHIFLGYSNYDEALQSRKRYIAEAEGSALYMDHSGIDIMLGHGSAGLEIDEQLTEAGVGPDQNVVLIIPVGAGGPIGIGAALKEVRKNVTVLLVQSDRWDALVRSLQTGRLEKNPDNIPPTFTYRHDGVERRVIFPDGIAVDGPEGEAVEFARHYADAVVNVNELSALQRSAVLLWHDLQRAYSGSNTPVKVGGTTALTAEALLSWFPELPILQKADAVVLFGTEGNVEPVISDYLESQQPNVGSIWPSYQASLLSGNGAIQNGPVGEASVPASLDPNNSIEAPGPAKGLHPYFAKKTQALRLEGKTWRAEFYEDVPFPLLEELLFSLVAYAVFGFWGLIVSRIFHIILIHLRAPPKSKDGTFKLGAYLHHCFTTPLVISLLGFLVGIPVYAFLFDSSPFLTSLMNFYAGAWNVWAVFGVFWFVHLVSNGVVGWGWAYRGWTVGKGMASSSWWDWFKNWLSRIRYGAAPQQETAPVAPAEPEAPAEPSAPSSPSAEEEPASDELLARVSAQLEAAIKSNRFGEAVELGRDYQERFFVFMRESRHPASIINFSKFARSYAQGLRSTWRFEDADRLLQEALRLVVPRFRQFRKNTPVLAAIGHLFWDAGQPEEGFRRLAKTAEKIWPSENEQRNYKEYWRILGQLALASGRAQQGVAYLEKLPFLKEDRLLSATFAFLLFKAESVNAAKEWVSEAAETFPQSTGLRHLRVMVTLVEADALLLKAARTGDRGALERAEGLLMGVLARVKHTAAIDKLATVRDRLAARTHPTVLQKTIVRDVFHHIKKRHTRRTSRPLYLSGFISLFPDLPNERLRPILEDAAAYGRRPNYPAWATNAYVRSIKYKRDSTGADAFLMSCLFVTKDEHRRPLTAIAFLGDNTHHFFGNRPVPPALRDANQYNLPFLVFNPIDTAGYEFVWLKEGEEPRGEKKGWGVRWAFSDAARDIFGDLEMDDRFDLMVSAFAEAVPHRASGEPRPTWQTPGTHYYRLDLSDPKWDAWRRIVNQDHLFIEVDNERRFVLRIVKETAMNEATPAFSKGVLLRWAQRLNVKAFGNPDRTWKDEAKEDILIPTFEEFRSSFLAYLLGGAIGLLIERVIHIARHYRGPPKNKDDLTVPQQLAVPILISLIPLVALLVTDSSLFINAFVTLFWNLYSLGTFSFSNLSFASDLLSLTTLPVNELFFRALSWFLYERLLPALFIFLLFLMMHSPLNWAVGIGWKKEWWKWGKGVEMDSDPEFAFKKEETLSTIDRFYRFPRFIRWQESWPVLKRHLEEAGIANDRIDEIRQRGVQWREETTGKIRQDSREVFAALAAALNRLVGWRKNSLMALDVFLLTRIEQEIYQGLNEAQVIRKITQLRDKLGEDGYQTLLGDFARMYGFPSNTDETRLVKEMIATAYREWILNNPLRVLADAPQRSPKQVKEVPHNIRETLLEEVEKPKIVYPAPQIHWMIRMDLPTVLYIERSVERSSGEGQWLEDDFLRALRQRNCIGMVAEHEDKVIGFMIYELHKTKLQMLRLTVHPEYRGAGVGRTMVEKLKSKLSSHRRTRIAMEVHEKDVDAQLFLKEMGFTKVGETIHSDKGDIYKMVYQLPGTSVEDEDEVKRPSQERDDEVNALSAPTEPPQEESPEQDYDDETPASGEESESESQTRSPLIDSRWKWAIPRNGVSDAEVLKLLDPSSRAPLFVKIGGLIPEDHHKVLSIDQVTPYRWGWQVWDHETLQDLLERTNPKTKSMVALTGNKVVGFVFYEFQDDKVVVLKLGVHPEFMRRGVATALIERLESHLDSDYSTAVIELDERNLDAIRFFRRMGWKAEKSPSQEDFWKMSITRAESEDKLLTEKWHFLEALHLLNKNWWLIENEQEGDFDKRTFEFIEDEPNEQAIHRWDQPTFYQKKAALWRILEKRINQGKLEHMRKNKGDEERLLALMDVLGLGTHLQRLIESRYGHSTDTHNDVAKGVLPRWARRLNVKAFGDPDRTWKDEAKEDVLIPFLEELIYSFLAYLLGGIFGLLIARAFHIYRHYRGPPKNKDDLTVPQQLAVPVLISLIPLVALLLSDYSLFTTPFITLFLDLYASATFSFGDLSFASVLLSLTTLSFNELLLKALLWFFYEQLLPALFIFLLFLMMHSPLNWAVGIGWKKEWWKWGKGNLPSPDIPFAGLTESERHLRDQTLARIMEHLRQAAENKKLSEKVQARVRDLFAVFAEMASLAEDFLPLFMSTSREMQGDLGQVEIYLGGGNLKRLETNDPPDENSDADLVIFSSKERDFRLDIKAIPLLGKLMDERSLIFLIHLLPPIIHPGDPLFPNEPFLLLARANLETGAGSENPSPKGDHDLPGSGGLLPPGSISAFLLALVWAGTASAGDGTFGVVSISLTLVIFILFSRPLFSLGRRFIVKRLGKREARKTKLAPRRLTTNTNREALRQIVNQLRWTPSSLNLATPYLKPKEEINFFKFWIAQMPLASLFRSVSALIIGETNPYRHNHRIDFSFNEREKRGEKLPYSLDRFIRTAQRSRKDA